MSLKCPWLGPLARSLLGLLVFDGTRLALAATEDIRPLLPAVDQMPGWQVIDAPRVFKGDELFELIDGGADLYNEYGFSQVATCRYGRTDSTTLQIEIYQMSRDEAAYGIYSIIQSAKGAAVDVGQAARLFDYYLVLWKGPYFVSVTASSSLDAVRGELLRTARLIAARITETGKIPALIERLPKDGLLEQKYFCGNLGLTNIHVFGSDDPFKAKEGVCGFYPGLLLFIFSYPSAEQAAARLSAASQALAHSGSDQSPLKSSAGFEGTDSAMNRISARQEGNCITVRVYKNEGPDRKPFLPPE
jgi:hypothetical protein